MILSNGKTQLNLSASCSFPEVFSQSKIERPLIGKRPESEVVYSRSDYDGRRWWTTWQDCQDEKPSNELIREIDSFQNALFRQPAFRTLDTMRRLCKIAEPTEEPTECNLYSETEHFYIWLRLITRFRDYNLYVHYYKKQI